MLAHLLEAELPHPNASAARAAEAALAAKVSRSAHDDLDLRQRLDAAVSRPEIALLDVRLRFSLAEPGKLPFSLDIDAGTGTIAPEVLRDAVAAAAVVRQACEIAVWRRAGLGRGVADDLALAMLACRTAGQMLATYPRLDRLTALGHVPGWLGMAWRLFANDGGSDEAWRALATTLGSSTFLPPVLQMLGYDAADARGLLASTAIRRQAHSRFSALAVLAAPTEWTLAAGGDPRVALSLETGRNSYGSATRPIAGEISLSSSTATTVPEHAYAAAEQARQSLIAAALAGQFETAFDQELGVVRAFISERTGAAATILTASGTDTELVAVSIALAGHQRPLTSIVLSPAETGSGIPKAAAGCHFLERTALGVNVEAGAPLEGLGGDRVKLVCVAIRSTDGRPRSVRHLDAEIAALTASAIATGRQVLLHVLDSSKTGLGAPSAGLVRALKRRYGDRLDVVIDACQMRSSLASLTAWLELGALVQITGSKFMAGPPFSGALLLAAGAVERLNASGGLPSGLQAYCGRAEWDDQLTGPAASLPAFRNLGLLGRWRAAMASWQRHADQPQDRSTAVLRAFAEGVTVAIAQRAWLGLVDCPLPARSDPECWSAIASILTVRIANPDLAGRWLDMAACKRVHQALQRDLTRHLAGGVEGHRVALRPVAVGQPVAIGDGCGALRLCASAVLVDQVLSGGDGWPARLSSDIAMALNKLELVLALGLHRPPRD